MLETSDISIGVSALPTPTFTDPLTIYLFVLLISSTPLGGQPGL